MVAASSRLMVGVSGIPDSRALKRDHDGKRDLNRPVIHSQRVRASALKKSLMALVGLVCSSATVTAALAQSHGQRVMLVILENADYDTAHNQPFLAMLAREGAVLKQSFAVARPSQPNYLALTAGNTYGVTSNEPVTLNVLHV